MIRTTCGVAIHDLKLPTHTAIRSAAAMGFGAVEILGTHGETAPRQLSQSGRNHLKRIISSTGMSCAAIDAEFSGGLARDQERIDQRIAETKSILELARDLSVPTVTASLGTDIGDDASDFVTGVLREIGDHADRTGRLYAVQTSGVRPESLVRLLERLNCPSLRICIDPAAVLMSGFDPVRSVGIFAGSISLAHARDAVAAPDGGQSRETAMGDGQVELIGYLAALEAAGYGGPQIIRRSNAADPVTDIPRDKEVLETYLRAGSL